MTDATSGTGTVYPSGAPEFTPVFFWFFCEVRVAQLFVLCVVFCRSLFVSVLFHLVVVLSVLFRFTAIEQLKNLI